MGHGEVFVLWDELKQYKVGQTVKFTAFHNKEGKIQAKDLKSGIKDSESGDKKVNRPVQRHSGGRQGGDMMQALASMFMAGVAGGVMKNHLKPQGPSKKDTSGGILCEFKGTIENRGHKYGFVNTKKGKVFVLWDELENY